MKRSNTQPLSEVLRQFLRSEGLETPYNEYKAISSWPEIAGEAVARLSGQVEIRNSIMYVKILRPALRQDLSYAHTALAQRINEKVGAQVIQDIKFY